jgi:hypothetical protein
LGSWELEPSPCKPGNVPQEMIHVYLLSTKKKGGEERRHQCCEKIITQARYIFRVI